MYEEIKSYSRKVKSFHMPGHKAGQLSVLSDMYLADVTEVEGLDDLHHPTGIIKETEEAIAAMYHAGKSYLLVNGATGGLLSAVSACVNQGETVLMGRNCHKSVYNAVVINQINHRIVNPKFRQEFGFFGEVMAADIEAELNAADIEAVIITSPTYEGIVSDIKAISTVVHSYGAVLIVDEAHGAHFNFSKTLPESALQLGADIVVQSVHKTLPSLTQTALLHVSHEAITDNRIDLDEIRRYLSIYQTSSPSYLLMSSIEKSTAYMQAHRTDYGLQIEGIIARLSNHKGKYGQWLYTLESGTMDVTRLTFIITKMGLTGWELSARLRQKHDIQVELAGYSHIVAISTLADSLEEIDELMRAVDLSLETYFDEPGEIDNKRLFEPTMKDIEDLYTQPSVSIFSIHEAFRRKGTKVVLSEGVGHLVKEFIIPYPPGIPLLIPGEPLTIQKARYLEYLLTNGMEVYGIIEGEITILD